MANYYYSVSTRCPRWLELLIICVKKMLLKQEQQERLQRSSGACTFGHEARDTKYCRCGILVSSQKPGTSVGGKKELGSRNTERLPEWMEGPLLCTPFLSYKVTLLHSHLLTYHRRQKLQ